MSPYISVGTSPNPPNGTLASDDPFGGETNGIPNGLQVPTLGLAGIFDANNDNSTPGQTIYTLPPDFAIRILVLEALQSGDFSGLAKLLEALHKLEEPALLLLPAAGYFGTAAIHYALAGGALVGGCLNPTPFEPATCAAGVVVAGEAGTAGTVLAVSGYLYFKNIGLPGLRRWWNGQ